MKVAQISGAGYLGVQVFGSFRQPGGSDALNDGAGGPPATLILPIRIEAPVDGTAASESGAFFCWAASLFAKHGNLHYIVPASLGSFLGRLDKMAGRDACAACAVTWNMRCHRTTDKKLQGFVALLSPVIKKLDAIYARTPE